jgi:hypothetical protein
MRIDRTAQRDARWWRGNNYLYWRYWRTHLQRGLCGQKYKLYSSSGVLFFAILGAVTFDRYFPGSRTGTVSHPWGFLHVHWTEVLMVQNCNVFRKFCFVKHGDRGGQTHLPCFNVSLYKNVYCCPVYSEKTVIYLANCVGCVLNIT